CSRVRVRVIVPTRGDCGAWAMGAAAAKRPLLRRTPQAADLRVPARHRESTHDSLAAPPVTVRAAHGRFAGRLPLPSSENASRVALTEGASWGAVVASGWLVRGDSWVESPPRAGYPLDDSVAPPAP